MAQEVRPMLYVARRVYPFTGGSAEHASALLTEGGRVSAVGTVADLDALAGAGAERVDLGDAVVLPGLIDTHPHLLHYGTLGEPLVDLTDAASHDDIVERLRARAGETRVDEWIMATPPGEPHHFVRRSARTLPEGRLPSRSVLDRASERHPIVIQAWAPTLPNSLALNSRALERLGIDAGTPDRIGNVWVEKDDGGVPTGRLTGSVTNYYAYDDFADELWKQIPFLGFEHLRPGTRRAMREYNAIGVTAVYENHMMDGLLIDGYRDLRARDELTLRVLVSQEAEAYGMPWSRRRADADFERRLEAAAAAVDVTDDWFRFNGLSLMWDGCFSHGGMMMRSPYRGPYGEPVSGFHNIEPARAEQVMRFCAERRLRLNLACMGTAAHDECLRALEAVAETADIAALRWVLVHAVFVTEEQVRRYRRLAVDVTTSMTFAWGEGHLYAQRIGDAQLADLLPLRRFFDAGFNVAGGTDWGPKRAFEHVELALTHEFGGSGHRNRLPDQRVTREEAMRMWTWDAARVLQWEDIGHLSPGCQADLVVVDRDPLTCDVEDIGATRVLRTVVGGRIVHDTGEL